MFKKGSHLLGKTSSEPRKVDPIPESGTSHSNCPGPCSRTSSNGETKTIKTKSSDSTVAPEPNLCETTTTGKNSNDTGVGKSIKLFDPSKRKFLKPSDASKAAKAKPADASKAWILSSYDAATTNSSSNDSARSPNLSLRGTSKMTKSKSSNALKPTKSLVVDASRKEKTVSNDALKAVNSASGLSNVAKKMSKDEKTMDLTSTDAAQSTVVSQNTQSKFGGAAGLNHRSDDTSKTTDSKLCEPLTTTHGQLCETTTAASTQLGDTSKAAITKLSDATSTASTKSSDAKVTDVYGSSGCVSSSSIRSNSLDSTVTGPLKPHTGGDGRWEAIQLANSRDSPLGLSHFRLLKRLGYGDIGSVYLVELRGTNSFFAMKVMDKVSLISRNKLLRAQTEKEILGLLDHPFLPTLYSSFETDKFYCLVMEYCSGGNLHSLRQKQPNKYFTEQAARFYASEVLLALEYLHMLGIVYRDLKPENVLVREEGHIMLSDFDLSLRCSVNPTLVKSSSVHASSGGHGILDNDFAVVGCIQPSSFFPRILPKKNRKTKSDFGLAAGALELMAEPTHARSMSFVGTHEYLAPEIICGEGHGSAVDWWTFGIFLYELLHGTTPFKGAGNRATLFNVVGQPLRFPEVPTVSAAAQDLIRGLLVKDPQRRIAYRRGATEIKQHPFFDGVNWALVRSTTAPIVPDPVDFSVYASKEGSNTDKRGLDTGGPPKKAASGDSSYLDFEYF